MRMLVKTLCTCSCDMVLMMHIRMTWLPVWWVSDFKGNHRKERDLSGELLSHKSKYYNGRDADEVLRVPERNVEREMSGCLTMRSLEAGGNLSKRAASPAIGRDTCLALITGGPHQHRKPRHRVRRRWAGDIIKPALTKIPSALLVAFGWLQHIWCPRFRRGTFGYGITSSPIKRGRVAVRSFHADAR
jgi:hypothetical protein